MRIGGQFPPGSRKHIRPPRGEEMSMGSPVATQAAVGWGWGWPCGSLGPHEGTRKTREQRSMGAAGYLRRRHLREGVCIGLFSHCYKENLR